jgi:predicted secreted protein
MKTLPIALLIATLFLAACAPKPVTPAPVPTLQVSDVGKIIEVTAGNEFKIIVESNPSTGYHWELVEALDTKVVDYVWRDYIANQPIMPGSGGRDAWKFKANAPGQTTITLGLYPPGDSDVNEQQLVFTIIVK